MTTSTAMASRYRPRTFDDVVGQQHVVAVLREALRQGRLPHQLLFSGGSGLGKTTLARVTAAALLCPEHGCGRCETCSRVADGHHPDVVEFDAASNGGVDEIRSIASRAQVLPTQGTHKVYIIDEAHGLSRAGGEAFLKLLEEPPPHVVFMLATTDPDKMVRANRGRCVEFIVRPPSQNDLARHLVDVAAAEGVKLPETDAGAIVSSVDPALGIRGCLMALERVLAVTDLSGGVSAAVTAALGIPPAQLASGIDAHIVGGDVEAALSTLAAALDGVDPKHLKTALVDYAYAQLRAAGGGHLAAAARLEVLLDAEASPAGLAVATARLCQMASPPPATDQPSPTTDRPPQPPPVSQQTLVGDTSGPTSGRAPQVPAGPLTQSELVARLRQHSRVASAAVSAAGFAVDTEGIRLEGSGVVADRLERHRSLVEKVSGLAVTIVCTDADSSER